MRPRVPEILGIFWPLLLVLVVQLAGVLAAALLPDELLPRYAAVLLRVSAVVCLLLGVAVQGWVARQREGREPRAT